MPGRSKAKEEKQKKEEEDEGHEAVEKYRPRYWWAVEGAVQQTEVLDNFWCEENKRGACTERGEPPEWQITKKEKRDEPTKWEEHCWARTFSWPREHSFQRNKCMQAGRTELATKSGSQGKDEEKNEGTGENRCAKQLVGG